MDGGGTCGDLVRHDVYHYLTSADSSESRAPNHVARYDCDLAHRLQCADIEKIKVIHFFSSARIVMRAECAIIETVENYSKNNFTHMAKKKKAAKKSKKAKKSKRGR